jgi:hypothetical protein
LPESSDINEQKARWRKDNPEKVKAIRRRYYLKHTDQENAYQIKYYRIHKGRLNKLPRDMAKKREYGRRYDERNREKRAQYAREYRANNRAKILEYERAYRARKRAERQAG